MGDKGKGGAGTIHPVILSGGSGTRLWPMSRTFYPKQLLPLVGDKTLLQQAALRIADAPGFAAPLVIANEEHRFIIAEQLREIEVAPQGLLLEPVGRNTAPAAAIAALSLAESDPQALMLLMPSDHTIDDLAAFLAAVTRAATAARAGHLVTFGIHPERAEIGYGYIERGAALAGAEVHSRSPVLSRSPMPRPPSATSNPAISSGTAAFSCSRRRST